MFVSHTEESVVRNVTVQDVLSGTAKLPFTTRSTWLTAQSECPNLRRVHSHLKQGTRPSKKLTNIKDVKRYLNVCTLGKDGLVVVRRETPFLPTRECTVIPREILPGLLTALHIKLEHPTANQLKKVVERFFYALDLDSYIVASTSACDICSSLQKMPHAMIEQSTSDPPTMIGFNYSADVIKREKQNLLVVRENTTSYTSGCIVNDEKQDTLREGIIQLSLELKPLAGPPAVIRTDPAPGFAALQNDTILRKHNLSIECGRTKNPNKNPIGEKAVQELEEEILRKEPHGGSVSPFTLAIVINNLNSRIRSNGLSAREMWTQRDQYTNAQLPISDMLLIQGKHQQHIRNHSYSENAKAPKGKIRKAEEINVGDLVYLYSDRHKSHARDKYLVVKVEGEWCNVHKFAGTQLRNTFYRIKWSVLQDIFYTSWN